jgi:hypothetical protein
VSSFGAETLESGVSKCPRIDATRDLSLMSALSLSTGSSSEEGAASFIPIFHCEICLEEKFE